MPDGMVIPIRRFGNPDGTRLVLTHGCGLAADFYYPYWSLLSDRFDICIFDMRSHGWNQVSAIESCNIPNLVEDSQRVLDAIGTRLGHKSCVGIFHSVSTIIAIMHQHLVSDFDGLVLFDPPVLPPAQRDEEIDEICQRHARRARRRQPHFDSYEDLAGFLGQVPGYSMVPPETLLLLAHTTLRPAEEGGYKLRCPPEHEAQLLEWHFGFGMQIPMYLDSIDIPLKAIGADPTVGNSYLPSVDLSMLVSLDYDFIPDKSHFLQLEAPEMCADLTVQFLEEHNLA
jgi:pimeloyl-ACP methyl ester carboxylesterase